MIRLSLLLAVVLALTPNPATATCTAMPLSIRVATPAGTEIPGDGGILVLTGWGGADGALEFEDPVRADWRLRGKALIAPKIELYAPGLAVYRVAFDGPAPMELEDETHKVVTTVKPSTAKLAAVPAPKVKSVVFSQEIGARRSRQVATATLSADPPAGAVALVIVDARGKATSWAAVAGGRTQRPYEHSGCAMHPNGTSAPSPGEKATLFWVMADGRRSPASKPVMVTNKVTTGEP